MPFGASKQTGIGRNYIVRPWQIYPFNGCYLNTAQKKFGTSSLFFDGVDDRANISVPGADLRITGELTWECWFYATKTGPLIYYRGGNALFPNGNPFLNYRSSTANSLALSFDSESSATPLQHQNAAGFNQWHHAAVCRDSNGEFRLYLNGVKSTTGYTRTNQFPTTNTDSGFVLGNRPTNDLSYDYGGFIDEVRISNVCRYTADFTPQTEPFTNDANTLLLLHMESYNGDTGMLYDDVGQTITIPNRIAKTVSAGGNVKISTDQSRVGSSSAYFDGNTDFLTVSSFPLSNVFDLTIELWAWFDILPGNQTLGGGNYMMITSATGEPYFLVSHTAGLNPLVSFGLAAGYQDFIHTGKTIAINTWYHIAIVRYNGNWRVYWDGSDTGTTTTLRGTTEVFESSITIGKFSDSRGSWKGYMDEFRISNIARYTSNFTPSTTAFTNDQNTLLLLHFEGANNSTTFTDDNA